MRNLALLLALAGFSTAGCGMKVDVTKTAKGFHAPTNPDDVEILMMRPAKPYVELGTVSVYDCNPSDTARMHNALRAKAAPLGANAVVLINSGIDVSGYAPVLWATGAAIRYSEE
jgi:hypothetical protein